MKRAAAMIKGIVTVFTLIIMISMVSVPAKASTCGSKGSNVITVKTRSVNAGGSNGNQSITLKNRAIKIKYRGLFGKTKVKMVYPIYFVKVRSTDGKQSYTKIMTGGQLKLSLKGNKTYKIQVSYDYVKTISQYIGLKQSCMTTSPYWWVASKTSRIVACF